jgi:hypothetical protein
LSKDSRKVDEGGHLSLPGWERIVEVVVHTDGVDENGKLRHAPAEDERGDGKLVLEASPIGANDAQSCESDEPEPSSPNQNEARDEEGNSDVARPKTELGEEDSRVPLDEPVGDGVVDVMTGELSEDDGNDGDGVAGGGTC